MTPTDPVRELKRRTAAGEVAPLADPAGHGDWHRSFHDFPFLAPTPARPPPRGGSCGFA